MLNLADHIVEEMVELRDVETDWKVVDALLNRQRDASIAFLEQALSMNPERR